MRVVPVLRSIELPLEFFDLFFSASTTFENFHDLSCLCWFSLGHVNFKKKHAGQNRHNVTSAGSFRNKKTKNAGRTDEMSVLPAFVLRTHMVKRRLEDATFAFGTRAICATCAAFRTPAHKAQVCCGNNGALGAEFRACRRVKMGPARLAFATHALREKFCAPFFVKEERRRQYYSCNTSGMIQVRLRPQIEPLSMLGTLSASSETKEDFGQLKSKDLKRCTF